MKTKLTKVVALAIVLTMAIGISIGLAAVPVADNATALLEFDLADGSITDVNGRIAAAYTNQEPPICLEIEKTWLDWLGNEITGAARNDKTAAFQIKRDGADFLTVDLSYSGGVPTWAASGGAAGSYVVVSEIHDEVFAVKVQALKSGTDPHDWSVEETGATAGFTLVKSEPQDLVFDDAHEISAEAAAKAAADGAAPGFSQEDAKKLITDDTRITEDDYKELLLAINGEDIDSVSGDKLDYITAAVISAGIDSADLNGIIEDLISKRPASGEGD